MAYFNKFASVLYNVDGTMSSQVTNILSSLALKYSPIKDTTLYFYYPLQDGERPEDVSYKFYETTEHHWFIMLLNDVVNPYFDWLLSSHELEAHVNNKYDVPDGLHHYENIDTGVWLDDYDTKKLNILIDTGASVPQHITPVSIRAYEDLLNEQKREIKVVDALYIDDIIKQFEDLMSRALLNGK